MPKITLYYDVVSPYSWFGFITLQRYKQIWNAQVDFQPIFLGAVMQATGNKPPATNPAKGKHLVKDLQLNNDLFKPSIPLLKFPTVLDPLSFLGLSNKFVDLPATIDCAQIKRRIKDDGEVVNQVLGKILGIGWRPRGRGKC